MSDTYWEICPKCSDFNLEVFTNWAESIYSGRCHSCGFYYNTQKGQMTAEELEEMRKQYEEEQNDKKRKTTV